VPHAPSSKVTVASSLSTTRSHEQRRTRFDHLDQPGQRHGLEPGNVLAIHRNVVIYDQQDYLKSRDRSTAIQLPGRYGLVYIFRTFNSVSYALVMESTRPVQGGDIVQNP